MYCFISPLLLYLGMTDADQASQPPFPNPRMGPVHYENLTLPTQQFQPSLPAPLLELCTENVGVATGDTTVIGDACTGDEMGGPLRSGITDTLELHRPNGRVNGGRSWYRSWMGKGNGRVWA